MRKTFLFLYVMAVLLGPVVQVSQAGIAGRADSVNLNSSTPAEGSTYFLLGGGLIALAMWTRRRRV